MKLEVVIPSFYPAVVYGGPIFTSLQTVEELAKIGIEIRVSTTNANKGSKLNVKTNKWEKKDKNIFIKYYNETIVDKISFPLLFSLWKDIKDSDIVHVQGLFSTPTPIALIYAKLFHKKVLLTPHGTLGHWCLVSGSRFKSLWLKWLIQPYLSNVIWHASSEKEKLEILSVYSNVNIQVIANGININEFEKINIMNQLEFINKFCDYKKSDVTKIIVSMGRLQRVKGFNILINSFVKVLKQYPNTKLLIAGQDEGEKQNLLDQIIQNHLENNVFLVGQISGQDKVDFLANANLFVLPSHSENFGIVYAESLAAGTPIVASKYTPWSEVEEADCGKWVNNCVDETADAILEMFEKDREQMRTNSKQLAKKYDWKNIALQFKEVFEKMINEK